MSAWKRFVSEVGEARLIAAVGGLELAMAVVRFVLWEGTELSEIVATDLLIVLPGLVLLYGGYWLPTTDLLPDVYSVVVARCVAG